MNKKTRANTNLYSGQTIVGECIDLDQLGIGIIKHLNEIIRVANIIPGEKAKIKLIRRNSYSWIGEILVYVSKSPNRIKPPCNVYEQCGGCSIQHCEYDQQIETKKRYVIETISRIGKIQIQGFELLHSRENQYNYNQERRKQ